MILVIEMIIVSIATILIGLSIHFLFGYHAKHADSPMMGQEMMDLSVILFFTGLILYVICKSVGNIELFKKVRGD